MTRNFTQFAGWFLFVIGLIGIATNCGFLRTPEAQAQPPVPVPWADTTYYYLWVCPGPFTPCPVCNCTVIWSVQDGKFVCSSSQLGCSGFAYGGACAAQSGTCITSTNPCRYKTKPEPASPTTPNGLPPAVVCKNLQTVCADGANNCF